MSDIEAGGAANPAGSESARMAARKRIAARRDFFNHLFAYVVINSLVVVIWASTGQGYFWPGWIIGAWGVGLLFHARDVFWRRPITDTDIDRELERRSHN